MKNIPANGFNGCPIPFVSASVQVGSGLTYKDRGFRVVKAKSSNLLIINRDALQTLCTEPSMAMMSPSISKTESSCVTASSRVMEKPGLFHPGPGTDKRTMGSSGCSSIKAFNFFYGGWCDADHDLLLLTKPPTVTLTCNVSHNIKLLSQRT